MDSSKIIPKVFISYAWTSQEYQEKVISLAMQLKSDGIDVILDVWHLKAGNDKNAFMEKSVNDDSVTSVLMLINPAYAEKANGRSGGVGAETQIITPEIYNNKEQGKYIPVIMEKNKDGHIDIPAYLKSTLYFDLSDPENQEKEYRRMVRNLYGEPEYPEPSCGTKPSWVDDIKSIKPTFFKPYASLDNNKIDNEIKDIDLINYLDEIKQGILNHDKDNHLAQMNSDLFGQLMMEYQEYRDRYLDLLQHAIRVKEGYKHLAEFIDDIGCEVHHGALSTDTFRGDAILIYLQELFIYTIAYYWKYKKYDAVRYLFNRTYFSSILLEKTYVGFSVSNGKMLLDQYICNRDNKKYLSGVGVYWMEQIYTDVCSKDEFVEADILCYNASIFIAKNTRYTWFPTTYIYGHARYFYNRIAQKLISKEFVSIMASILGFKSVDDFVEKYTYLYQNSKELKLGYSYSFDRSPYFFDVVKPEELAMEN